LEYDIAAQAKTLEDCQYQLERLIAGHVAIALENKLEPFAGLPRAPEKFWTWFRASRIPLDREPIGLGVRDLAQKGVVLFPPTIRVAQPQAA
jgi:hypothetical protein